LTIVSEKSDNHHDKVSSAGAPLCVFALSVDL